MRVCDTLTPRVHEYGERGKEAPGALTLRRVGILLWQPRPTPTRFWPERSLPMLRRLHLLLTVVSTLLLVGVLVLWARSGDWNDEFVLRTARSYVTGPLVKRIALRSTTDGVAVSVHVKVTPSVALESPPWREDVPVGGRVAAAADDTATFGGAGGRLPYPPGSRWGRPMTPREQSDFET